MAELLVSAPAKINLHLEVLGLRPDGFHELAMVMQTLDLADRLSLRPTADGRIALHCNRKDLPTDGSNLIVKAAELLRARVGLPELGVAIELDKRIPIGAGLAGGSSNGAAALVGLNELWGCGFSQRQLLAMAAELGSDMPFCIDGGTQLCFGRGEVLEPVALEQPPALAVLLIKHPQASVSTPWAYGRCREQRGDFYLQNEAEFEQRRALLRGAPLLAALRGEAPLPRLRNDLQAVVEPEVASVREGLALLREAPQALAVAMSGSGPSLFALFADAAAAETARAELAEPLAAAGFEAWVCRCTGSGATLV
ncbi:MAG: 4-(cytidine 5'-diphospho)-2-C-methyl-D-erythritol kinase [Cyanobacteria bacterium M_surface_10_m2_179]|nr:4-(cytidine 5'-diphospho)-2-C-methyl-D-erythritol kinase [Cyanobacteria bacterium M_surface_10_m2_179]